MNIATYYRTARYTRWSQLLWRARYALERYRPLHPAVAARLSWRGSEPPKLRKDFPDIPMFHRPGPEPETTVALLKQGVFSHLSKSHTLGRGRVDWRLGPVSADRLWTMTLHYHAWAYDLANAAAGTGTEADQAAMLFKDYLTDWMEHCALQIPGTRYLTWNSYAIATRLTWWIRSYRLLADTHFRSLGQFEQDFLSNLWQQAEYLHQHLEWDLRGNHLLHDAVGLAWAGRFFAEKTSRQWLATATRLAEKQVAEQILPDGGHFERSPMYHLHIMEDILALALLVEEPTVRICLRDAWQRMAEYIAWLRHPDGEIPLFNDAALDAACEPERMMLLGERLGVNVNTRPRCGGVSFADSGMIVWHGEPWSVFFDVGPVGPDYQPGHAHADNLSIECSYAGTRFLVDPGCFAYDYDERRRYDRSSAAHNTVCIDHADSSEVWHIFRVGRRARPVDVKVQLESTALYATAGHTGYDHLPGSPRHHRELAVNGRALAVTDRIDGVGNHGVEGGFTLAPDWNVRVVAGGWELERKNRRIFWQLSSTKELKFAVENALYHPGYGLETNTRRLVWRYQGDLPLTVKSIAETV